MNRRDLLRLAALAGMGGGLAACGIDTHDGVVVDGAGPTGGSGTGGGLAVTPPSRAGATLPAQVISAFLAAPAGIYSGTLARVREFIAPTIVAEWKPSSANVNVVRPLGDIAPRPEGSSWVQDLDVLHIGVLREDGSLGPPAAERTSYTIKVSNVVDRGGRGYYVQDDPPQDILLSENALGQYYMARCLYFWNHANNSLVPDLRYVTRALDETRRLDMLVEWLMGRPAPWLDRAVNSLANTKKIGNVVEKDGKIIVNLSSGAKAISDPSKLTSQLRWTLRKDLARDIDVGLEIESEPKATVREYLSDNLAWRRESHPELFAISEGTVIQLESGAPAALLRTADNSRIESAAITRDGQAIAVVRRDSADRRRLQLAPRTNLSDGLRDSGIAPADEMSRPIWLYNESVLIAADGELWQAWRDGSNAPQRVPGRPRDKGAITWVAIGADSRRAALIVGGRLYVAAIDVVERAVTLAEARHIPTSLTNLTTVVFGAEDRLVIAGTGARGLTYIGEINVDGAQYKEITKDSLGKTKVRSMSAYTLSPTDVGLLQVVFSTGQNAQQLTPLGPLTVKVQPASASPIASASPSTSPSTNVKPLTNPFYAG